MTPSLEDLIEKYWNSKPKKKVTGEGIVVSLTKKDLDTLIEQVYHARTEEVKKIVEGKLEEWAAVEHERWSKWQAYLHSKCFASPEYFGALIIPADLIARWQRQINTPYAELSEAEKESDREQVRPYLTDLIAALSPKVSNK